MAVNFCDAADLLALDSPHDSDGSTFTASEIEKLDANSRTNHEYDDSPKRSVSNKPIISVARRNERERKRVRLVNQGFAILRDRVPRNMCHRGRRSSKVETLRAAIMYIRQLQQLLLDNQIHYQENDFTQCYSYVGNDTLMSNPFSTACDNYVFSNGFTQEISSYPHLRTSVNMQNGSEICDRYFSVPWFAPL